MRPAAGIPAAAERGRLVSRLAKSGVTGVDLAAVAGLSREAIGEVVAARICQQKGAPVPPPRLWRPHRSV